MFRPSSGQRCAAVPSRPRHLRVFQEHRVKVVMFFDPFSPSILLLRGRVSSSEQAPPPLCHAPPHARSTRLCPAQAPSSSSRARARASSPRTEPKRAHMAVLAYSGRPAAARRRLAHRRLSSAAAAASSPFQPSDLNRTVQIRSDPSQLIRYRSTMVFLHINPSTFTY